MANVLRSKRPLPGHPKSGKGLERVKKKVKYKNVRKRCEENLKMKLFDTLIDVKFQSEKEQRLLGQEVMIDC